MFECYTGILLYCYVIVIDFVYIRTFAVHFLQFLILCKRFDTAKMAISSTIDKKNAEETWMKYTCDVIENAKKTLFSKSSKWKKFYAVVALFIPFIFLSFHLFLLSYSW